MTTVWCTGVVGPPIADAAGHSESTTVGFVGEVVFLVAFVDHFDKMVVVVVHFVGIGDCPGVVCGVVVVVVVVVVLSR